MFNIGQRNPTDPRFNESVGKAGDYSTPSSDRPLGITIIALLNFLISILFGIVVFEALASPTPTLGSDEFGLFRYYYDMERQVAICIGPILVVLTLAIAIGLWRMRSWAYPLAVGTYGLIASLLICNSLNATLTVGKSVIIGVPVAILVYLLQPAVRELFRERPPI